MKRWRDYQAQWKVWQPELQMSIRHQNVIIIMMKNTMWKRKQPSFGSDFDIYTHASLASTRGRCTSYRVAVTLTLCRTVEVGISAHRPQHILCLKTDTKLTSSRSLSQILWPTFNGKTQLFVVGYWKLSLWLRHAIVNNSCSKSFLSLVFSCSHSLSLIFTAAERRGQWLDSLVYF